MPRSKPVSPYVGQPKHYALCPYCCVQGDELRAENERLRTEVQRALEEPTQNELDLYAENQRLRAALGEP